MAKGKGQDYALYLSEDDPGSSNYTNISQYDLVGFATEHSLNFSKDLIEAANKDSSGDQEYVPGRRTQTIEGTFHLDKAHAGDSGQESLWNNIQDNTSNQHVWFLLTDNVSGNQEYYGKALVEELDVTFPDQDMIELSATLQVDSGLSRDAVS